MQRNHTGDNIERSEYYGALQRIVDALFEDEEPWMPAFLTSKVRRFDVVIMAEAADLPDDLMRIVNLLPPGEYTRQALCDQINSAITGHAWGQVYGTVS